MKTSRILSVAILFALPAFAREPDVGIQTNVMVPMRDGVKLATDIYLPAGNSAKLPVILTRLPYSKDGAKKQGEYYAQHGYVFVAQDTRGRYASEGVWHMMTDDGRDGVDCAAWIAAQSWSDGKIGMIGTSYVGGTQHAMAMEKASQLTTVIPVDAVSNPGRQSMRNAGAFEMRFWNWIMLNAGRGIVRARFREGLGQEKLMQPGETYPFKADIVVSVDDVFDQKLAAIHEMPSQHCEGGTDGSEEHVKRPARLGRSDPQGMAARPLDQAAGRRSKPVPRLTHQMVWPGERHRGAIRRSVRDLPIWTPADSRGHQSAVPIPPVILQ